VERCAVEKTNDRHRWLLCQALFEGFFVHLVLTGCPAKRQIYSLRILRLIFTASIDFSRGRAGRRGLRSVLMILRREAQAGDPVTQMQLQMVQSALNGQNPGAELGV
jgi:hypothetical protein